MRILSSLMARRHYAKKDEYKEVCRSLSYESWFAAKKADYLMEQMCCKQGHSLRLLLMKLRRKLITEMFLTLQ